jgi:amino acid transporter
MSVHYGDDQTEARTGAPRVASLTQSAIGFAVIVLYALAGWDPMVRLFFGLGTTGTFGVLCLLTVTSIAVIRFFARDPRGEGAWRRLVAPALAAIAYGLWLRSARPAVYQGIGQGAQTSPP